MLGDIDIVGYVDAWQFLISVNYVEIENKSGKKTGELSIASGIFIRVPDFYFHSILDTPVVYAEPDATGMGVSYWKKENVQGWCIGAVGQFNDDVLEVSRRFMK